MTFTVAIVGRPNVGKSTLFNRLTGKRQALVDDMPGVTRDRREGEGRIAGLKFQLLDTAGLEEAQSGSLQARMTAQTLAAIEEADVSLLVVDGRAGITATDRHFVQMLRKGHNKVVLVVNKAEGGKAASTVAEAFALGLGDPVPVSAEHGDGLADLHAALAPFEKKLPDAGDQLSGEKSEAPLQLAIVGRPNVGKSTLMNRLLGEERVLTGPEAGITRDSIAIDYEFQGHAIKLIDTAGMRRKANVTGKVEKLAVADTLTAVQFAHVVILVIDAQAPLEKQDNTIAALIEQEGRAMVLAVNKWDMVADKDAFMKDLDERLEMVMPQVKGIPVVPISAETGFNIEKLLKACLKIYGLWTREFGTGELNRWLEAALEQHMPPLVAGRRIKIRYMTQKTARPPTFLLFANSSDIPDHYMRYLVNHLREQFRLPGIPIRIKVRKNKNPYTEKSE